MNKHVKLSIITINYNNASGLSDTIKSVVSQNCDSLEYIVIDGASTDESVEVIKSYETGIDYWVSEPDRGIYHAMNKGIAKASGEYVLMLNSGDMLFSQDTLQEVVDSKLDKDVVYGDVQFLTDESSYTITFPDEINFSIFLGHGIHHQSVFIRKKLHDELGLYDETVKITADWRFFLDAFCRFNCSYKHIPIVVSSCPRDGISCDPSFWPAIQKERNLYLNQMYSAFINDYREFANLKESLKWPIKVQKGLKISSWKKKFMKK